MSDLVNTSKHRSRGQEWLRRIALGLGMLSFVGLVTWAGLNMTKRAQPQRQVAKIMLLPDTPPPPPPPPPDKPKVEPKTEMKQQVERQKQQTPPEPQQLKMEGQAGEGPSPFAAGDVKNDYIGGDIGNGARFAAYVNRIEQLIQEQLAKRNLRIANAKLFLWLSSDGALQRYEINGASGDSERQLRTAMATIGRVPEAPPQDMPMPMGLEISEH
jgi:protein TonB